MNQIPRILLVGCGYWGKNLARNFHTLDALAAICESDPQKHASIKEQYPSCKIFNSYGEALQDDSIDGVVIATPAETHATLVKEAILAGKDVFVEKPLCLTVEDGKLLVALAKEKERLLMVGHLLWYHPAVLKLKELIDNGELGRIQYMYSNRLNLGKIRREENILWSFAPHDMSVILGLLGEEPKDIQAQGGNYLHQQISDVTVSLLSFPSGVKAHIFVSWLHPFKEQKLIVVGDRKMAVFNDMETKDKLVLYPHFIDWKNQAPVANKAKAQPVSIGSEEPLQTECQHFLDCIVTRRKPRTDGEEGLRVLTALQDCQNALGLSTVEKPFALYPTSRTNLIHESAYVDNGVEIGEGTNIWHFSHILKGSSIGKNCKIGQNVVIGPNTHVGNGVKIQNNVSVYEGVILEDNVFCGPSMVFTNVVNPRSEIPRMTELKPTIVKQGATLGANCTVLCGVSIGQYALIGAGAVVLRDVQSFALVVGNPARQIGWSCRCGEKLQIEKNEWVCAACGDRYQEDEIGLTVLSPSSRRNTRENALVPSDSLNKATQIDCFEEMFFSTNPFH